MKTKQLIELAQDCDRLIVAPSATDSKCIYITENKWRGAIGIVIWPDGTINRTDIPLDHQNGSLRVYAAARLLGLEAETHLPLAHAQEYDSAAEWCARRGFDGAVGSPLPPNMATDGALKYINADPEAFQARVREFAYGIAMESHKATA